MWTTTTCWSATSTSTTPTGEGGGPGACALCWRWAAHVPRHMLWCSRGCVSALLLLYLKRLLPLPQAALWHHCEPAPPRLP